MLKQFFRNYKIKQNFLRERNSLVVQWVKDLALSLQWLGHWCGTGSVLGLGTSICCGAKKKKFPARGRPEFSKPTVQRSQNYIKPIKRSNAGALD